MRLTDGSNLPDPVAAVLVDPPPGRASVVDAGGYQWHMVEWGDPADPPLLLVHGVTSSSETFWRVGPGVAATRRRVVAVDLPGHGLTGGWRRRHRFAETAADLAGFIRAAGLAQRPLQVLGHSWGAMVAAALPASGYRPERLILLDPPSLRLPDLVALSEDPLEQHYDTMASALEVIRASGVPWSDGDIAAKAVGLTQVDATAARSILRENGDYDAGVASLSVPAAIGIPTWIIRGEPAHGALTSDEAVAQLAELVAAEHVITISGGPHSPQRSHPEATILAILRALA